jgi:Flavin containing amine oxidoreductase
MRFVEMLLLGEMCVPLSKLTPKQVLGTLYDDSWYRIQGGSSSLVVALKKSTVARFCLNSRVLTVQTENGKVAVKGRRGRRSFHEDFDAAIITCPDGERLIGRKPRPFHSYVSILLKYETPWWRSEQRQLREALLNGLYLDTRLNFLGQVMNIPGGRSVLRVLIPNARNLLHSSDADVIALCVRQILALSPRAQRPIGHSVQPWKFGVPAGSVDAEYSKVSSRIYLAGDRFGSWPSMETAIQSGRAAARAMMREWGLSCRLLGRA